MTSSIEELHAALTRRLPHAHVSVEAPPQPGGSWWIDVQNAGRSVSVEWRPGQGFGISGTTSTYGEGPEHVVEDASAAATHVAAALASDSSNVRDVLLASGDSPWRRSLHEHLLRFQLLVEIVDNAADAAHKADSSEYRAVIIDVQNSADSEFERLSEMFARKHTRVFATTTVHLHGALTRWVEVIVQKSLDPADFASMIEASISRHASAAHGAIELDSSIKLV